MNAKALKKAGQQVLATKKKTKEEMVDELVMSACKVTGTERHDVADRIIVQVANAQVLPKPKDVDECVIKAIETMAEIAPQNVTEAMLAAQMVATHDASLMFLQGATVQGQSNEGADGHVLRATRLMRVFNEQLEAMARLKGKTGQQKVIVEHVHVYQGGQAIVGAVSTGEGKRGRGEGDGT